MNTNDRNASQGGGVAPQGGGLVHMHGILSVQGGAARVMRLLAAGLAGHGFAAGLSCEVKDSAEAEVLEITPGAVAEQVPPAALCHVHGSRDWPALLRGFQNSGRRVAMITLHDCALLTGGCIHPQDCPGWLDGCLADCPQGCAAAPARQAALREGLLAQAPVLVSPSAWLRKMVRAALPDLRCELIPNGVADPWLTTSRERARAAFGLTPGVRVALFAAHGGALAANKGGRDFLAIWPRIKAENPGAVAFIVGGTELSRQGDIYYWPYVDSARMHSFMLAADVFISASPAENHSLLVLEAMAAGVPVCAYKTGGVPEQVTDGETGLLAPLGDIEALGAALGTLLAGPSLARDMGAKARARYERGFGAARMVAAYARLYSELSA